MTKFRFIESCPQPRAAAEFKKSHRKKPWLSLWLLSAIVLGCLFAELIMTKNPQYLHLAHCNAAPNWEFLFGTDSLGRDIFSGIWYGGRISLAIGFFSTLVSTALGIVYGTLSGLSPAWLDRLLMRFTELFLSLPSLLLLLFLQSIWGNSGVLSLSLAIGLISWPSIAKVVRTEVRQLRRRDYILASKCMGGGFFHILWRHLVPSFFASIVFMVVTNVRSAIMMESTLSFLGMGLPLETLSWGSMLSLAENALLSQSWWSLLIPGVFLVTVFLCLTNIGNFLRKRLQSSV